ncbi:biphenyl-2,3-diol 1,2-dioxygenase 2 [Colletotrichum spaethianum]|uniref:Biphenyl-2,3-diol 1,2-dioxygenase 2 n=1 Tax=Colletotrichum spaethianum TaxID=700344 RepID=A0AA37LG36_9PEZI|nr:biphenyl-2,3-diol 1,2-dioxygenase 2 [Colletotrichum spaethianum]GKT43497.1 biphenyl-2,3-diol 1,2-dioxygenase 2 [Colletotrichum spaethianum]
MAPFSVPAPSEIAHLGFRTSNPQRLVDFYLKFLGARVVLINDFISVLTWDQEHHRLAIINDAIAIPKKENTCGLDHVALKFASVGELVKVYQSGREAGIKPFLCLNHGVSTSLYYRDPDGNRIEALIEAYNNPEDVQKHMATLDPLNIKAARFDPEDLMRRVNAGEDDEALRRAGFIGPSHVAPQQLGS